MKLATVIALLAFAVVSLTLADDPTPSSSTSAPAPSSTSAPAPSSTSAPAPSSTSVPAPSSPTAPPPSTTPVPAPTPTPAPTPKDFCTDKKAGLYYKDPRSGKGLAGEWSCMIYHECVNGTDVVHHCFWLIPLWQYNPSTRDCRFFLRARCADLDP